MTSKVMMLIQNSEWLEPFGDISLALDQCDHVHQVIERVFVNVSARAGKLWKDVYFARETQDQECYALLIISLILIDTTLKENFEYDDDSMQKLLGANIYKELEKYKESSEKF